MITHTNYEEELMGESVAEVRAHWKGMFIFGAPDVMVVNITPDSIWAQSRNPARFRQRIDGPAGHVPAWPDAREAAASRPGPAA